MRLNNSLALAALALAAALPHRSVAQAGAAPSAQPASATPITITVDATDAPRKMLHADLVIPVQPGDLTLVYAKWIPGEHEASGPIDDLAGIVIKANGQTLALGARQCRYVQAPRACAAGCNRAACTR